MQFINKKYPKLQIDIYTNASLLNKKLSEELLKTNLHKINKENITRIEVKIDNLSINMDKKLNNHQNQIIKILSK